MTTKRILSLVLALTMIVGMFAFGGTSAAAVDKQADYTVDGKAVGEQLAQFTDIAELDAGYYDATMVLAALGIRTGNTNKELTPKTTFTRGAAATLLAKAYNTPATWEQLGDIYVSPFVDHVSDYGNGDGWAYALGYMSGTGSAGGQIYFSPKREISVIEFTGMLVKMLGYTLTENYKTDIIRFASEANLFRGITISDPNAKITYEQASLIMVNALQADRVASDRNSYTGQNYDTYSVNRTPLLYDGTIAPTSTIIDARKYNYTLATLTRTATAAEAHDAYGYPGTALILKAANNTYSAGYIAGFVPHFTSVGDFTAGLTTLSTAGSSGHAAAVKTTGGGIVLNGAVTTLSAIKNSVKVGAVDHPERLSGGFLLGTYVDVVSYTDASGELNYKDVAFKETASAAALTAATEYKLSPLLAAKNAKATVDVGSFALYIKDEANSGATSKDFVYFYAEGAKEQVVTVTSNIRTLGRITYVVDGVTATGLDNNFQGSALGTESTAVEGRFKLVIGSHGVLYNAGTSVDTTWTALGAKYLFIPALAGVESNLFASDRSDTLKDDQFDVIYDDGSIGVITLSDKEALNGAGAKNYLDPDDVKATTFYEYTVVTGSTVNLFDVAAPAGGAAAVAVFSAAPYVTVHDSRANLALADPGAKPNWGGYLLADMPGAYTAQTVYTNAATTFTQVIYPYDTVATASWKAPVKNTGVGYNKIIYPDNISWLAVLALNAVTPNTAVKEFIVHFETSGGADWASGVVSPDRVIKIENAMAAGKGANAHYLVNTSDGVGIKINKAINKTVAVTGDDAVPSAIIAANSNVPVKGDYGYLIGSETAGYDLYYINNATYKTSPVALADSNIGDEYLILDGKDYSNTTVYLEVLDNAGNGFYPAIYVSKALAAADQTMFSSTDLTGGVYSSTPKGSYDGDKAYQPEGTLDETDFLAWWAENNPWHDWYGTDYAGADGTAIGGGILLSDVTFTIAYGPVPAGSLDLMMGTNTAESYDIVGANFLILTWAGLDLDEYVAP
ncbi:MAG: S-layer homology domain-containing protein [Oscillospiraceae bacterium]|jgi:hypothetical protein|nr:S-layer homology domain-containing protein [Oscillospiraceae bacterium]